jgi:ArsR family transcriptional regulator
MKSEERKRADLFKALADENRLRILRMLQEGERCACELLDELQIGQSTLSHHMKILCDSGLVEDRKQGRWIYYSISEEKAEKFKEMVGSMLIVTPIDHTENQKRCCGE